MNKRSRLKQYIVDWLLRDENVKIPPTKIGENTVKVGNTDITFDANGGLVQQDGTRVLELPNDGTIDFKSKTIDNIGTVVTDDVSISDLGAEVTDSTGTSIPNQTNTKVEFDSEIADDGNHFDSSSDYEFTVPRDGDYQVSGHIAISGLSGNTTRVIIEIVVNATNYRVFDIAANTYNIAPFCRSFKGLSQNDTIHIEVWQGSGSSQSLKTGKDRTAAIFQQEG